MIRARALAIVAAGLAAVVSALLVYPQGTSPAPVGGAIYRGRIGPDTQVEFRVIARGGERITRESATAAGLVGLYRKDLNGYFPGWQVARFTAKQVVLEQHPVAKTGTLYLGIKDGYVAVFAAPPKVGIQAKQVTSVPVGALQPQDRLRLAQGIAVPGEEGVYRYLEGIGN